MTVTVGRVFPTGDGSRIEGFMFDVDGTLLLSDRSLGGYELLPGAVEVLGALKERRFRCTVLRNQTGTDDRLHVCDSGCDPQAHQGARHPHRKTIAARIAIRCEQARSCTTQNVCRGGRSDR